MEKRLCLSYNTSLPDGVVTRLGIVPLDGDSFSADLDLSLVFWCLWLVAPELSDMNFRTVLVLASSNRSCQKLMHGIAAVK